jgi:hypothetical protein
VSAEFIIAWFDGFRHGRADLSTNTLSDLEDVRRPTNNIDAYEGVVGPLPQESIRISPRLIVGQMDPPIDLIRGGHRQRSDGLTPLEFELRTQHLEGAWGVYRDFRVVITEERLPRYDPMLLLYAKTRGDRKSESLLKKISRLIDTAGESTC